MVEHVETEPVPQTFSLHVDADLARVIDSIAEQDGASRSEVLRTLVLRSLETEVLSTSRCRRALGDMAEQLQRIAATLEEAEEEEAVEDVLNAIASTKDAIDSLG